MTRINDAAAPTNKLQAVEAAFRHYVEQCPDAVLVTDPAGRIVYVNPAFERMTGYAAGEIAGRTPALLKSGIHEADFYRRLWVERKPKRQALWEAKMRLRDRGAPIRDWAAWVLTGDSN